MERRRAASPIGCTRCSHIVADCLQCKLWHLGDRHCLPLLAIAQHGVPGALECVCTSLRSSRLAAIRKESAQNLPAYRRDAPNGQRQQESIKHVEMHEILIKNTLNSAKSSLRHPVGIQRTSSRELRLMKSGVQMAELD